MKIGLTVWGFAAGVREAVDLAVFAEERGFDSVFMVEGVYSNDALTTVAGMAGRTSRIAIGTGIANVFLRHPVMLALAAAAVDDLSDGRFLLGLGPNNREIVTRAVHQSQYPREAHRATPATVPPALKKEGLLSLRSSRQAKHLPA